MIVNYFKSHLDSCVSSFLKFLRLLLSLSLILFFLAILPLMLGKNALDINSVFLVMAETCNKTT